MTTQIGTIIKKFNSYQKERFPLAVLVPSLIPAILSSGVVASSHPTILQICIALASSVAYLLHIRIIDEHRDFAHDNTHHSARPIQAGVISKEELRYIDIAALAFLFIAAVISGPYALAVAAIMLAYSYVAGKEFFIGEKIRRHFFIYNCVNLVQMLLMQIFVYAIFAPALSFNVLILAHFLFTTVGTIVFEFVRKIKIPGQDGTGKDTYTWHMGFGRALNVYIFMILLDTALFFWITAIISPHATVWLLFSAGLASIALLSALAHRVKKTQKTDQLMQLSLVIMYGTFNIAIYFIV